MSFKAIHLVSKITARISWNKHTIFILLKYVRPICQVKSKYHPKFWILRVLYSGRGPGRHRNHTFAPKIILALQSNYKSRVNHILSSLSSKLIVLQGIISSKKLSQELSIHSFCSLAVLLLTAVMTSRCSYSPSKFLEGLSGYMNILRRAYPIPSHPNSSIPSSREVPFYHGKVRGSTVPLPSEMGEND